MLTLRRGCRPACSSRIGPKKEPLPPTLHIGPSGPIDSKAIVRAMRASPIASSQPRPAATPALERLLLREPPALKGWTVGQPIIAPGQNILAGSLETVQAMDHTCLYVQGPPGSGKTYTASRMIACLLAEGWRVGVTSNSHKVINHMLSGVMGVLAEQGQRVHAVKKCTAGKAETEFDGENGGVENLYSSEDVLMSGAQLVAGTAWLFSHPAADQQFDVLFVDEAGQVALANLVGAGTCARNIVLLGDQMQLSQPVQGVHPGRSGDSALDYLLDGAATIARDRGIFLATSHRLHPAVCRFISDAVYDGRLQPRGSESSNRALVLDGRCPCAFLR